MYFFQKRITDIGTLDFIPANVDFFDYVLAILRA